MLKRTRHNIPVNHSVEGYDVKDVLYCALLTCLCKEMNQTDLHPRRLEMILNVQSLFRIQMFKFFITRNSFLRELNICFSFILVSSVARLVEVNGDDIDDSFFQE